MKTVYIITSRKWRDFRNKRAELRNKGYNVVNQPGRSWSVMDNADYVYPLKDWHLTQRATQDFNMAVELGKTFLSRRLL